MDAKKKKVNNTSQQLPESIRYLQPAIDFFNSLGDEELHEDTDKELLLNLLRERIAECDVGTAQGIINSDRETIERYLDRAEVDNPGLYYILGFIDSPDLARFMLRSADDSEPSYPQVSLQLPEELTANRTQYGHINVTSGELSMSFMPLSRMGFYWSKAQWYAPTKGPMVESVCKTRPVQFRKVKGRKRTYITSKPVYWKRVEYLLRVPGGFVWVTLDAGGKDFDELTIEPFLHTLRVER
ncbi:MAG: hypothetical protein ACYST6_08090 [Planctomycetota bacterium]